MLLRALLALMAVAALARAEPLRVNLVTDDGLPLPDATVVQVLCGGRDGQPLQVDSTGTAVLDAPNDGGDCELQASAPGYDSARARLSDLPLDPLIPGISLRRLGKNEGETISVTHLTAPAQAVESFHAAVHLMQQQGDASVQDILSLLTAATDAYPGYANAWFEIGRLRLAVGDVAEAAEALGRAIEADPWFVSPYEPLMLVLRALGRPSDAADACNGLRRINPALPQGCRVEASR
ncbi:MAG: bacterial transcriptional activator domain-containing protein [Bryobacterales bacterium]|nr:bacterial transcriptional activator domain-containing protein [Bryobacterales bacterium]